jgi:hypothetical protein
VAPEKEPAVETLKVYRGSGRTDKSEVYSTGIDTPILGEGKYYAFDEESARQFGPKIEQAEVAVRNPYRIESDDDYVRLVRAAGLKHAKFWQTDPKKVPEAVREAQQKFQDYLKSKGHDSVIVRWSLKPENDLLAEAFGGDQVFVLGDEARKGKGELEEASISEATLPRRIDSATEGAEPGEACEPGGNPAVLE